MLHPILAKSIQVESSFLTAAVLAFVWGLFRGIEWLVKKYTSTPVPAPQPTVPPPDRQHWTDVTGEMRPVNSQECAGRHAALTEELKKGSERMGRLNDSVQEVKTELVRMGEQIGAGVDLRIREVADRAAGDAVAKHEASPYHQGKAAS